MMAEVITIFQYSWSHSVADNSFSYAFGFVGLACASFKFYAVVFFENGVNSTDSSITIDRFAAAVKMKTSSADFR